MRSSLLLLLFLSGCGWSFPMLPSNPPDRQFHHSETEIREPRFVVIEGKTYPVVDKIERTYDVGMDQKVPKIPGWKRVLNALFGWSLIGGILILILTILGVPAIPALLLAIKRIRANSKSLQQIVASVDDGIAVLPADQQERFKAELSKTQDTDVKKTVARIKEGI